MIVRPVLAVTGLLLSCLPGLAADPGALARPRAARSFVAFCEDLGQLCFAAACGSNQIRAERGCRAQCPSAVIISVRSTICDPSRPVGPDAGGSLAPP